MTYIISTYRRYAAAMENIDFEIMPSADRSLHGSLIDREPCERDMLAVKRLCRMHGANYAVCKTGTSRCLYKIVLICAYRGDSYQKRSIEDMARLVNDIDCKTSLFFKTENARKDRLQDAARKVYGNIEFATYDDVLTELDESSVVASELGNCPMDRQYEYMVVFCTRFKADMSAGCIMEDEFAKIYEKCIRTIRVKGYDIVCRIAKPLRNQISKCAPVDGITFCRKIDFVCGPESKVADFCVYMVQYGCGDKAVVLIGSDGKCGVNMFEEDMDITNLTVSLLLGDYMDGGCFGISGMMSPDECKLKIENYMDIG